MNLCVPLALMFISFMYNSYCLKAYQLHILHCILSEIYFLLYFIKYLQNSKLVQAKVLDLTEVFIVQYTDFFK
jgi:hypothetical protein